MGGRKDSGRSSGDSSRWSGAQPSRWSQKEKERPVPVSPDISFEIKSPDPAFLAISGSPGAATTTHICCSSFPPVVAPLVVVALCLSNSVYSLSKAALVRSHACGVRRSRCLAEEDEGVGGPGSNGDFGNSSFTCSFVLHQLSNSKAWRR